MKEWYDALWRVTGAWVLFGVWVVVVFLLGGCAPQDEFTREYNQAATIENWSRCNDMGYLRLHVDHIRERERLWSMQDDLARNNCRRALGALWVDRL